VTIEPFPLPDQIHTIVLDFDGVFTDNKVWVDQDGRESVRCDRADGLAFDMLRHAQAQGALSVDVFILSKEPNPVVLSRAKKLQLACQHGIRDKRAFLSDHFTRLRPDDPNPFTGLLYVGNDLNDAPVMRKAGWAAAPADAHPAVRAIANIHLTAAGGHGCVRELVERLLRINEMTEWELDELISNC